MALLRKKVRSLLMVVVLGVLLVNARSARSDAYSFAVLHYPGSSLTMAEGINNDGVIFGHVLGTC